VHVRAVAYTPSGTLWFAAPQFVGCREAPGAWRLFTGTDGLPFNYFTCMAAGSKGHCQRSPSPRQLTGSRGEGASQRITA